MSAERRTLNLVLVGLTLIGLVAGTAWFLNNFEPRTEQVAVGATAAARRNPFLAAERFLTRLGIPVEGRAGRALLREPPPTTDTLVVNGLGPLNGPRRAALRAWLKAGGRLVVAATNRREDGAPPDDLLAEFGIRLEQSDGAQRGNPRPVLAEVAWGDGQPPLRVAFAPDWYLEAGDGDRTLVVRAAGRTRLVQQAVGAGRLAVTSDQRFLTNDRIGQHDHALVFARLARPAPGGKVWLLYDSAVPGLGALLWAVAPGALVAGAVLVLVWAWSLGARLGPRLPPPDRHRRDLLEHLAAAAAFLWRHGRASQLVVATRRQVLAAWQRRRPQLRHLAPGEQAAAIAAASARPVAPITTALQTQAADAAGFIDQARLLKSLWEAARPGGTGGPAGPRTTRTHSRSSDERI